MEKGRVTLFSRNGGTTELQGESLDELWHAASEHGAPSLELEWLFNRNKFRAEIKIQGTEHFLTARAKGDSPHEALRNVIREAAKIRGALA